MYDRLTEEQKAKLKGCKSREDFLRKVQEEGIELTDEQLEAISGGGVWSDSDPVCFT